MKFRSQHIIHKPLSSFWSSIPFAQFLKTTSSSHLLLTLKLAWGWDGPVRLRTGFPLRMFSIGLFSSSAFVLVPSWRALQFLLFEFFPALQEELQCHPHHTPLQNLHLPPLLEGGLHQAWQRDLVQWSFFDTEEEAVCSQVGRSRFLFCSSSSLCLPALSWNHRSAYLQGYPEWSVYILSLYERVGLCLNIALSVSSNHLHLFRSHLFLQVRKLAELLLSSFTLWIVTGNLQTLHCPTRWGVALCRVTCTLCSPWPPETGETHLQHWVLCLNPQRPLPAPPTVWFPPATLWPKLRYSLWPEIIQTSLGLSASRNLCA